MDGKRSRRKGWEGKGEAGVRPSGVEVVEGDVEHHWTASPTLVVTGVTRVTPTVWRL